MNKVNKNEAPEGYVAKEEVLASCKGCSFYSEFDGCTVPVSQRFCFPDRRKDNRHVIFVRKPNKKKSLKKRVKKLEKRVAELEKQLDKPKSIWEDAPEEVQWLAMDKNGKWHWHHTKPTKTLVSNKWRSIWRAIPANIPETHPNWEESLQQRPKETK